MTRRRSRVGLTVVAVLVLVALAVFFVAPWYARRELVATAEREGIHLTVERAALTPRGFRFHGLTASRSDLPGSVATVEELELFLRWLTPQSAEARGVEVNVEGELEAVLGSLRGPRPVAPPPPPAAPPPPPILQRVTIQRGHLRWSKAFGAGTFIDAEGVVGDLAAGPNAPRLGDELHLHTTRLRARAVSTEGAPEVGPWALQVDRTPARTTLHLELMPAEPRAAWLELVEDGASASFEAQAREARLSALGLPPTLLGLPGGQDPSVQVSLRHDRALAPGAAASGTARLAVRHLRLPAMTGPADLTLDLAWRGEADGPWVLERGHFDLGPFPGDVKGSVARSGGGQQPQKPWTGTDGAGLLIDATLEGSPVPCSVLAGLQAADTAGPLGALAAATGLTQAVGGQARLSGRFHVDTRVPGSLRIDLQPTSDCSLSLRR